VSWARERFDAQLKRFFDVLMNIVFDVVLCICTLLSLYVVVCLTGWLFPEKTEEIELVKKVSSISGICSYTFYVIFDLFRYVIKTIREEF
jgi:hypothetical protein